MRKLTAALRSALIENRVWTLSARAILGAVATAAAFALVAAVRFYRLDGLQGEWYGDISTLFEYATATRNLDFPPSLYVLGVGPLYALALGQWLSALGVSYFTIKLCAVLWSLGGLGVVYWLCRQLLGSAFALIATVVAGTGSWLLIYSRLGDVQAAVPLLTLAPLAIVVHLVDRRPDRGFAALWCGVLAGACLYVYGAAFTAPLLVTAALVAYYLLLPAPGFPRRHLLLYFAGLLASLLPLLIAWLRAPRAFADGHLASRVARGPGALWELTGNASKAMLAYVTKGDPSFRGNPSGLPHVDRLGLVLALVGVAFWLAPRRRKWGLLLIAGFLVMHLPSIATNDGSVPSAARTIGAAPLLYILVATGIWWPATLIRRRWGAAAGAIVATVLVLIFAAVNLRRYFHHYIGGLPYENTHIARAITAYVDLLPADTAVHLIGSTWAPGFMPEPKSIQYTMRRPRSFQELSPQRLDCSRLLELERPAVLIWSHSYAVPGPQLVACREQIAAQLFSSDRDLPMFHAASLPSASLPAAAAARSPAPPSPVPPALPGEAGSGATPEPPVWSSTQIVLAGAPVEMRYLPIDAGQPIDAVDGRPDTLMRGASDNPYVFELRYPRPTLVAAFSLALGFMPEYEVEARVRGADGTETVASAHGTVEPGSALVVDLELPNGPTLATAVRIAITDIREQPGEGWHIHLFELRQR